MATQDSNPFGGAAGSTGGMFGGGMWGAPQGGMSYGMPPQQGYGGYGGGYGGFGGGYGGFGGGMPYGGGYGMQSPYGGSYGGYGGMQSPYGMPQGYGGGYGMQSPYGGYGAPQQGYGGYSPYGMPSQYGPQPSYGMPQQQSMMAPQSMAATAEGGGDAGQMATASGDTVSPAATVEEEGLKNFNIGGSTTQTNRFDPWGPQQEQLRRYLSGMTGRIVPDGKGGFKAEEVSQEGMETTGAMGELYKQQQAGPLGFDPQSEAALRRMQEMSTGANPLVDYATQATRGIASGQYDIGTGGMFQGLFNQPGIQNLQQYQNMYENPGITTSPYGDMYQRDAIGNANQYNQMMNQDAVGGRLFNDLYQGPGINQEEFRQLASNPNSIGTGRMEDIYGGAQGAGSLAGGMFGDVARGGLVNGNPYREQAIQQAMGDTADQVKATMSSRGRYGSDAYGDAMGKALGQVATQARMAGYDTDTANMMAAAQARSGEALSRQGVGLQAAQGIMSAGGQNFQNQLAAKQALTNAAGARVQNQLAAAQGLAGAQGTNAAQRLAQIQGLSGVQGQNYSQQLNALQGMNAAQQMANQQRMAAAQGLTGAQGQNWQNQYGAAQGLTGVNSQDLQNRMAAAGMAPAMQGLRYDDINRQLQAGATREAMAQQQRNFGWDTLRQFQGLVGGVPGSAGTSKGTESQPWWQSALGAAGVLGGMWGAGAPTA